MADLTEWSAAFVVGERVIEMADLLRTADKVVPGSTAKDGFTLDGLEYEITMKVKRA